MSLYMLIRQLYRTSKLGQVLLKPAKLIYDIYWFKICSEKKLVTRMFKLKMGYNLNLENPQTLNEKIQWLKLYDRTELHTICADKFSVRSYVKDKIGSEYLV